MLKLKRLPKRVAIPIIPVGICSLILLCVHLIQVFSLSAGLDSANVDFSGKYTPSEDSSGFNNRGNFTRMPLDRVDDNQTVTVVQKADKVIFSYIDWKGVRRVNSIRNIGSWNSKWKWTEEGLAGAGLPVKALNLFILPGLVFYDQRGTIKQTSNGLVLDYTWSEGGVLFWIVPWKDSSARTTVVLDRIDQ